MRIGLITGEYPPDQGGVGDFTQRLGQALADLNHDVHVITGATRNTQHATREKSQVSGCRSQVSLTVHRVIQHWRWGCWKEVRALARDLRLDVLDVQYQAVAYDMHPAINFVPRRPDRLPVVVTFHDLKVPYLFPKAGPLRRWVVQMLARRADGVVVTNREDELRISDLKSQISNLIRIPIGSNIPISPLPGYDRKDERARWEIEPQDVLLGYFGFLNESKGAGELIQALARLVEEGLPAQLLMVGGRVGSSDPTNLAYADRVEKTIADLDLTERVHWTGYARPELVSAGLLATDVCVLPYRDGVSFRRGTLHACLAHGRAIVTTQPAVPLPEVRDGENMVLTAPRDPDALAEAVTQVATDPALRARLEEGAKMLAAEFTWERIARRTGALFARLLEREES